MLDWLGFLGLLAIMVGLAEAVVLFNRRRDRRRLGNDGL